MGQIGLNDRLGYPIGLVLFLSIILTLLYELHCMTNELHCTTWMYYH